MLGLQMALSSTEDIRLARSAGLIAVSGQYADHTAGGISLSRFRYKVFVCAPHHPRDLQQERSWQAFCR